MRLARDYVALVKFSKIRSCYLGACKPTGLHGWHEVSHKSVVV
jgi:hypothetical protein